ERGTGKKYVYKDGKVLDFCSRKCEKNLIKLRRTARTTKWTQAKRATVKTEKPAESKKEAKKSK
ncbi:MAG TPA: 50S ribosomal protein L24e, partial [Candidatus Nanoarchaeia archaeon]|nr:50S ribosomal protein L24e [Candidatus Nanoarchaeia archaeon]